MVKHSLPFYSTKAGPGEKEPAFIVLRRHCCKLLALSILTGLLVGVKLFDDGARFAEVKIRLHGATQHLNKAVHEHMHAHAEMARVGEEFEQHLDRDLKELEMGQHLVTLMRAYQNSFEANLTAIVSEVLQAAASDVSKSGSEDALRTVNHARDVLSTRLHGASSLLFAQQSATVGKLVQHLASGAKEASERREDLQGEILHNLHDAQAGEQIDPRGDDAGWGEVLGNGEEEDDHWTKETDRWHNETVTSFFHRLDEWLHPVYNETELGAEEIVRLKAIHHTPQSYTNTSVLYLELKKANADLDQEVVKWHDIQVSGALRPLIFALPPSFLGSNIIRKFPVLFCFVLYSFC